MTTETMNISFLGVDNRSKSAYEIFFNSIKRIKVNIVEHSKDAQLCLVDKDAYNVQPSYEQLIKEFPNLNILILSLQEQQCERDNEFFLRKPVKRDSLQESLNLIFRKLSGKPVPKQESSAFSFEKELQELEKKVNESHKQLSEKVEAAKEAPKEKEKIVSINEKRKASAASAAKLLRVKNEEHFVGDQADVNLNDPKELEKIYYDPSKYLQSIIEHASLKSRQTEQIIQLNVLNHIFYFDAKDQKIYSTVGPGIIRPLCLIPHDKNITFQAMDNSFRTQLHEIMQSNKNKTSKKTLEKQNWDMEAFTWLITLWCSRGRIPEGIDVNQPVYLMQWPNLTRLASIPHAVRIAALLYDRPRTLIDTARQLGIEQRYVFAFFSASKSIGLANMTKRQVDKTFKVEKPEKNKNQSILSKIFNKLSRFSDKSSMNEIA